MALLSRRALSGQPRVASAAPYAPLAPALCPRTAQGRPDVGRAVNAGPLSAQDEAAESRSMVASTMHYTKRGAKASSNPVSDFFTKVNMAWRIFFPEKLKNASPKEEVKRRLKMVLVADRCGMSPASLSEMKKTIAKALQDFVDIETEDAIEVSITVEPTLGTVYSVNIPVRRVKPETRFSNLGVDGQLADGITLEWDPADWNSDPSSRFPMGC